MLFSTLRAPPPPPSQRILFPVVAPSFPAQAFALTSKHTHTHTPAGEAVRRVCRRRSCWRRHFAGHCCRYAFAAIVARSMPLLPLFLVSLCATPLLYAAYLLIKHMYEVINRQSPCSSYKAHAAADKARVAADKAHAAQTKHMQLHNSR